MREFCKAYPVQDEIILSDMAEKEILQVAAAVIEHRGWYLITRREAGAHLAGYWEFPGGKREAGETFEACARREVFEEVGIEITAPRLLTVTHYDYPDRSVELHFFYVFTGSRRAATAWLC